MKPILLLLTSLLTHGLLSGDLLPASSTQTFYWDTDKKHDIQFIQNDIPGNEPINDLPVFLKGRFVDDYDIHYTINDSVWIQNPGNKYHILKWNKEKEYLLVQNDINNPSAGGLYTRIDYMEFTGMKPWQWGFCLTVYDAASAKEAEQKASADRLHPKTGCGGFPFSRMKREQ